MADAQQGRRPLPLPDRQVREHAAAVTGLFFFAEYSND